MEIITKKSTNTQQQLKFGIVRKYHYDAKIDKPRGAVTQDPSKIMEIDSMVEKEESETEGEYHKN